MVGSTRLRLPNREIRSKHLHDAYLVLIAYCLLCGKHDAALRIAILMGPLIDGSPRDVKDHREDKLSLLPKSRRQARTETSQSDRRVRQSSTNPRAAFALVILGATFLMGSSFVAGKILLDRGIPPMLLVGWRFLVAALFALPLALLGKHWKTVIPRSARDAGWIAIIGLTQTAAVMGLLFYAMRTIPASTAAILLFTNPLWVAMLGPFFLGERLGGSSYVGLLLGIVGVALAIGIKGGANGGGALVRGDAIAILSAVCWAVATIINKRIKVGLGTWAVTFWQMLVGSVAVLAIAYAEGDVWPSGLSNQDWGWFLWLAVPASTGSFGLWFAALEKGGATRCSGFLFLTPLFTILLSFLVLGHPITWTQVGGGLMVGVAIALLGRGPRSKTT